SRPSISSTSKVQWLSRPARTAVTLAAGVASDGSAACTDTGNETLTYGRCTFGLRLGTYPLTQTTFSPIASSRPAASSRRIAKPCASSSERQAAEWACQACRACVSLVGAVPDG